MESGILYTSPIQALLSLSLHHFIIAFVNCDAQKTTLLMDIFLKVDVIKFIGKK